MPFDSELDQALTRAEKEAIGGFKDDEEDWIEEPTPEDVDSDDLVPIMEFEPEIKGNLLDRNKSKGRGCEIITIEPQEENATF